MMNTQCTCGGIACKSPCYEWCDTNKQAGRNVKFQIDGMELEYFDPSAVEGDTGLYLNIASAYVYPGDLDLYQDTAADEAYELTPTPLPAFCREYAAPALPVVPEVPTLLSWVRGGSYKRAKVSNPLPTCAVSEDTFIEDLGGRPARWRRVYDSAGRDIGKLFVEYV